MPTLAGGLKVQNKTPSSSSNLPPGKRKPIFGDDDSESEDAPSTAQVHVMGISSFDEASEAKTKTSEAESLIQKGKPTPGAPKMKSQSSPKIDFSTLRTQKKRVEEAEALDPSIFDYDAAFDALHAKSTAKKAAERADAAERKPKYIGNLLEAAEIRKRDQLRAQDKLVQREREAEGDEFADKEKFVTEAYKEQQKELRKLEEEEKKREERETEKRQKLGMAGFYRTVMDEEERKHQEAVEAAAKVKPGEQSTDAEPAEKSEAELARELNAKGAKILLNEEGQVADKRQLLSAGLNVAPKPKANNSNATTMAADRAKAHPANAVRSDIKQAMRERQSRMMAEQLEKAAKRAADEDAEDREKVERAAKSQKTQGDISSAKERYLQRKREAAAAGKKDAV